MKITGAAIAARIRHRLIAPFGRAVSHAFVRVARPILAPLDRFLIRHRVVFGNLTSHSLKGAEYLVAKIVDPEGMGIRQTLTLAKAVRGINAEVFLVSEAGDEAHAVNTLEELAIEVGAQGSGFLVYARGEQAKLAIERIARAITMTNLAEIVETTLENNPQQ